MSVAVVSCAGRSMVNGAVVEVLLSESVGEGQVPLPRLGETVEVAEDGRTLLSGVWLGLVASVVVAGRVEAAVLRCGAVVRRWVPASLVDCRTAVTGRSEVDDAALLALLSEVEARKAEQDAHQAWLDQLVADAHEEADDRDWCSEFDDFMERAGLPRRERDFTLRVDVTATLYLTRSGVSLSAAIDSVDRSDVWSELTSSTIEWEVDEDR